VIHPTCEETAVDGKHMAGDIARRIGREKDCRSREFVEFAETPHRRAREEFLATFGAVEQSGVEFRAKDAGCDGVDANAFAGPFDGQRFGQRGNRGFAGGIGSDFVEGDERGERGYINDATVAAFDHVATYDAARAQSAGEIRFENAVPLGVGNIHGGCALGAAGGVDQNLHAAEFLARRVQQVFDRGFVGDITGNFERAPADSANFFCGGTNEIDAAAGGNDVRASLCKSFGDFEPDAACTADNESGFLMQFQAGVAQVFSLLMEAAKAFRFYSNEGASA